MLEKLFKKVPIGSDITIMNTMYQYRQPDEEGKWQPDYIALVYKDNETGNKDHIIIKNPNYRYYKLKDGYRADYNRLFVEEEKTIPIEVPYKDLLKSIAENLDEEADFNDAMQNGDRREFQSAIMKDPRIFMADKSMEDLYRFEFAKYYKNSITKLKKAFFDIEVDSRYLVSSDFPEPEKAECPINAISTMDETKNIEYTFLLRNPENPLIQKFEDEYNSGKFTSENIHNFVQDAVGGWKQMKRNKLDNLEFQLFFFDNEIDLLRSFFLLVYKNDPDFIEGWNSSGFDINYIINRIIKLGYNPAEIMSDPNWEFPFLKHFIDHKNINDFAERGDYTRLACNPVWIDQMIQFCSRRKAKMGSFTSFKLDDIAWLTAKVHKLDYSNITTNLAELPWLDYKTFVLYNIMDVINQKCIENNTQDLEYIFAKCIVNNTTYAKGHRQTIYLINRMTKEWYNMKEKYIIGNNANKDNPKPEKFSGAIVENPLTTDDYAKQKTSDGNSLWIADNLIDFDFKSLYPSVMLENNIAPNTQISRIDIWNEWKCKLYPDKHITDKYDIVYLKDPYVAYEYPYTEIKENNKTKKVSKKVEVYCDKECTKPYFFDPNTGKAIGVEIIDTKDKVLDYKIETISYTKYYPQENPYGNDKYSRGGDFVEDLVTDNIFIFAKRWLHLAGINEFLDDWEEYNKRFLKSYTRDNTYGRFNYNLEEHRVLESPFVDMGNIKVINPFVSENISSKPMLDLKPLCDSEVNLENYDESKFHGYHG